MIHISEYRPGGRLHSEALSQTNKQTREKPRYGSVEHLFASHQPKLTNQNWNQHLGCLSRRNCQNDKKNIEWGNCVCSGHGENSQSACLCSLLVSCETLAPTFWEKALIFFNSQPWAHGTSISLKGSRYVVITTTRLLLIILVPLRVRISLYEVKKTTLP